MGYYAQFIASPVTPSEASPLPRVENRDRPKKQNPERKEIPSPPTPTPLPPPIPKETCLLKKSTIAFQDYQGNQQKIELEVCDSLLQASINDRSTLRPSRNIPKAYVDFDSPRMEVVVTAYKDKITQLQLNKIEAAEYIVSSIQNIPYTLVHNFSHEDAENPATYLNQGFDSRYANEFSKSIKKLHSSITISPPLDRPGGCLENVKYGIVTPLEMYIEKMGDCDSRVTALYLVLKKLGYDVICLVSDLHQHAILGLNLPGANGGNLYYPYRGRKYYIWETTAFHPVQTRLGVHRDGALYKSNWGAWKVLLN